MMQGGVQGPFNSQNAHTAGHESAEQATPSCYPSQPSHYRPWCHAQHTRAAARYHNTHRTPLFLVFLFFSFFWARTPECTCTWAGALQLRTAY
jgi:hypothetical protein